MPESPEIRFLKEKIYKKVMNKTLTNIVALSKRKVPLPKSSKILNIGTKGKLMFFECKDYYVHIQFGLSGWMMLEEGDYTKYILEFNDSTKIYLDDSRKFSKISIFNKKKHLQKLEDLGPDILTKNFTLDVFKQVVDKSQKRITDFLLDQHEISGVGNYIRNECLYLAGISPKRKINDLTENEKEKLYDKIRYVAFSNLITLLKENHLRIPFDIKKIMPKIQVPYKFHVYEREKDLLGNKITYDKIGGRNTYYVKKIQI